MRAKYCKSKNTYTIDGCKNCNCPDYWKQGVGRISAILTSEALEYELQHEL